jgi:hypothetical protein
MARRSLNNRAALLTAGFSSGASLKLENTTDPPVSSMLRPNMDPTVARIAIPVAFFSTLFGLISMFIPKPRSLQDNRLLQGPNGFAGKFRAEPTTSFQLVQRRQIKIGYPTNAVAGELQPIIAKN